MAQKPTASVSSEKGEAMAATLDYAPLPPALEAKVLERVKTIKY